MLLQKFKTIQKLHKKLRNLTTQQHTPENKTLSFFAFL